MMRLCCSADSTSRTLSSGKTPNWHPGFIRLLGLYLLSHSPSFGHQHLVNLAHQCGKSGLCSSDKQGWTPDAVCGMPWTFQEVHKHVHKDGHGKNYALPEQHWCWSLFICLQSLRPPEVLHISTLYACISTSDRHNTATQCLRCCHFMLLHVKLNVSFITCRAGSQCKIWSCKWCCKL